MVQVVAHHGGGLVQQVGNLVLALPLESLLHQVDVVAPAGLDEDLAYGGALWPSQRDIPPTCRAWFFPGREGVPTSCSSS